MKVLKKITLKSRANSFLHHKLCLGISLKKAYFNVPVGGAVPGTGGVFGGGGVGWPVGGVGLPVGGLGPPHLSLNDMSSMAMEPPLFFPRTP